MPTSKFGLVRLLAASGLFILATFHAGLAQETPVDPNYQDIPLPQQAASGFEAVSPLAQPEINYGNCAPAQGSWHPPIYYPSGEIYCPTGVVCRDWLNEKTIGFSVNRRQRMLEKDYVWRMQNAGQPVCCPPHSHWGHSGECYEDSCRPCVNGCQTLGDETSAIEQETSGIVLAGFAEDGAETSDIQLVSDEQYAPSHNAAVEPAGFFYIGDRCRDQSCSNNGCTSNGCTSCFGKGCRACYGTGWCDGLRRGYHFCPLHRRWCRGDDCDECEDDRCDCFNCRLLGGYKDLCRCLYTDGPGGWRREIPHIGHYYMSYPVNPHHFDQRDGRIYAAQGYGHPVGVPLAPNVQHTYNYGWGLPSSRLTPVSRMPGGPGVANPAAPGAAGPGIYPPAFPMPLTAGMGQ